MPLYVANNEPEEIANLLKHSGIAVEVKHLQSGDYVFDEVGIERKTVNDLISTLYTKKKHGNRLWGQLDTLRRTYKQPMLLIEGQMDWYNPYLRGILTSLFLAWKFQIISTADHASTVQALIGLFIKYGAGKTGRVPPPAVVRGRTVKEVQWGMLQCVQGIGPVAAKKILEAEPQLFKRFQDCDPNLAPKLTIKQSLDKVKGIKKEAKEMILRVFTE
jgi:ERCC4-type nuclease